MDLAKGVELKLEAGKLSLSVDLKAQLEPLFDSLKAKLEAGELDLVHGTDLDKDLLLKALDFAKENLVA